MSRIGKQPVVIPAGVKVNIVNRVVKVEGPKGKLEFTHHSNMTVAVDGGQLTVTRPGDDRENRALHGLTRALINNMVVGVTKGYEKKLKVEGVGYQAVAKGKGVELMVGFANKPNFQPPEGITCQVPDPTTITPVPWHPELGADFIAHVELRFASGLPLYSGAATGDQSGFMRFRRPPATFGLAHFVTLVDSWPPAPVQCLAGPARFSTLTWSLELLTAPTGDPESQWWYEVTTDAAHAGYGHSHARVFTASGVPVAISRQTISLFG
jgi:ribosomal protein L6P/L9E